MDLPALTQLMGAYYHQDWDLDYDDDESTIRAFVAETPDLAGVLGRDITKALMASPSDVDAAALLHSLGCQVDPSPSSRGSHRAWLAELAALTQEATTSTNGD